LRLLLDTHAFLWFVAGAPELSPTARGAIEDGANDVFVSIASAWEIAIKVGIGKLSLDAPSAGVFFDEQMATNGFAYLSIEPAHVFHAGALPLHHRDPFDRLLIAQALAEQMALVTREDFRRYGVGVLW
jgi:PIN domain nuclease of toxin-antitoxin system